LSILWLLFLEVLPVSCPAPSLTSTANDFSSLEALHLLFSIKSTTNHCLSAANVG
jgi:hypothetical protein